MGKDFDVSKKIVDIDGDGEKEYDEWIIAALVIVSFIVVVFWIGSLLAALVGFDWLSPSAALKATPGTILNLVQAPDNPAMAWPAELRSDIPSRWIFYPVLALTYLLIGLQGWKIFKRFRDRNVEKRDQGITSWATAEDLENISIPQRHGLSWLLFGHPKNTDPKKQGMLLGYSEDGEMLFLEKQSHALVVAGTRSGKTAGLCAPGVLDYEGVIIATSVKADLVKETIARRQQLGRVFVFDPTDSLKPDMEAGKLPPLETTQWSPLATSNDWRAAQQTASALITASAGKDGGGGNMKFFINMASQALPVLLYAAAVAGEDMRRVSRWLNLINDPQTSKEIDAVLRWKNQVPALETWNGFIGKDPKLRGDIAATIQSALVSYEDPVVQQNALRCDITPEALFDGGMNTLYVVAPPSEQSRLEPIFVTLMQGLFDWVTTQTSPLDTPVLAVIDEAANIAALPKLPEYLSVIGGLGVSFLTAWQDFAQIKGRYAENANTILNNSRAKMILPGVGDPDTLRYFADITGEAVEKQVSVSSSERDSGKKGRSYSTSEQRRQLLTPATIRQQPFGSGILVYGDKPPARVKLRMYFEDSRLIALTEGKIWHDNFPARVHQSLQKFLTQRTPKPIQKLCVSLSKKLRDKRRERAIQKQKQAEESESE